MTEAVSSWVIRLSWASGRSGSARVMIQPWSHHHLQPEDLAVERPGRVQRPAGEIRDYMANTQGRDPRRLTAETQLPRLAQTVRRRTQGYPGCTPQVLAPGGPRPGRHPEPWHDLQTTAPNRSAPPSSVASTARGTSPPLPAVTHDAGTSTCGRAFAASLRPPVDRRRSLLR